jgi:predicted RND superfamily exporter protein
MKTLLLIILLAITPLVNAGAPKDSYKTVKSYPVLCTPTLSSLIEALTTDYAVHVASTFIENPEAFIMIVENPDTETAAIIRITEDSSCLIFSGAELQHFVRPEGMAPPVMDINKDSET